MGFRHPKWPLFGTCGPLTGTYGFSVFWLRYTSNRINNLKSLNYELRMFIKKYIYRIPSSRWQWFMYSLKFPYRGQLFGKEAWGGRGCISIRHWWHSGKGLEGNGSEKCAWFGRNDNMSNVGSAYTYTDIGRQIMIWCFFLSNIIIYV